MKKIIIYSSSICPYCVSAKRLLENLNLKRLASDSVYVSCTMILPLRSKGSAGSPIRPIAIGSSN